jgi:hypothetical protein
MMNILLQDKLSVNFTCKYRNTQYNKAYHTIQQTNFVAASGIAFSAIGKGLFYHDENAHTRMGAVALH